MILYLKDILFKNHINKQGTERDMHRKLCVHAQFSVLMVRPRKLTRINSSLVPKLKDRDQNEIDIVFEDNYNLIKLGSRGVFLIQPLHKSSATASYKLMHKGS
jgi:hypothetical protein